MPYTNRTLHKMPYTKTEHYTKCHTHKQNTIQNATQSSINIQHISTVYTMSYIKKSTVQGAICTNSIKMPCTKTEH